MLSALLALALLAAPPAHAQDDEGRYPMNDVGANAMLPEGWTTLTWADWELKAESKDRAIRFKLWMTAYQVEVTEEAAKVWADQVKAEFEEQGHGDVTVADVSIVDVNDRKMASSTVRFSFKEDPKLKGVVHELSYTSLGQVVHMYTLAAERNDAKAKAALDEIAANLRISKNPQPVAGPEVSTEAGFAATLPEGWRVPVSAELGKVRDRASKVGEEALAPETCWAAISPPPSGGDPGVIFACKMHLYLGPVDDYSFEGVEKEVHEKFFGRSKQPVAAAEKVQVGDRLGFYYHPPVPGMAVRLAMAPYEGGMMTMWGMAPEADEAKLDGAMHAILTTVTFSGPDGGAPIIGFDKRVAYYVKYRPTSPLVIGPAALAVLVVVGGVLLARRKGNTAYDE